jgi:hypothetical protein
MNISVVTTFHKEGYNQYGKRMIETFLKNWPQSITLYVYAEDVEVTERAENLIIKDLHQSSPALCKFKNMWKEDPRANGDISGVPRLASRKDSHKPFKWDAIRFSHKVYAIFDCAQCCKSDVLFWMDADIVCHSPITHQEVESFCPNNIDLGYLGRDKKFSECGLYSLNLHSQRITKFLKKFQELYDNAESGIFTLEEWHDSFVFDQVRHLVPVIEYNWSKGLITGEGHPLINSNWGAWLDHLKGKRKDVGRSFDKDLRVVRKEKYWTGKN